MSLAHGAICIRCRRRDEHAYWCVLGGAEQVWKDGLALTPPEGEIDGEKVRFYCATLPGKESK